jgi:CO/xanthine dehydrogenase FAD-binding subunit
MAYDAFHTGYKRTAAAPDEIVRQVIVPRRAEARVHYYRKVGPRRAQAISKVCFAACAAKQGGDVREARVALGGVAPVPLRAVEVERAIVAGDLQAASEALARAVVPIDDVRSTARYRRRVADNLLRDFLQHVAAAPQGRSAG